MGHAVEIVFTVFRVQDIPTAVANFIQRNNSAAGLSLFKPSILHIELQDECCSVQNFRKPSLPLFAVPKPFLSIV